MPTTSRRALPYPSSTNIAGVTPIETLAKDIDDKLSQFRMASGFKVATELGWYEEKAPNLSGWILVQTNIPFNAGAGADKMMRYDVRGYTYFPYNNHIDFSLNWYMLSGAIHSGAMTNTGTMQFKDVRILRNNTTNNLAFCFEPHLESAANQWGYPKLTVDGWTSWSTELTAAEFNEVTITRVTALTGYTTVHTFTADAQWWPLTLLNGWQNYDTGGHTQARYRRLGNIVEVQGLIKNGTFPAEVANLPQGFRPNSSMGPADLIFPAACGTNLQGRVDVNTSGQIIARPGVSGATTDWFSISAISFPVSRYA